MKWTTFWLITAVFCLCIVPVQAQESVSLSVSAYRLDEQTRKGIADSVFTLYGADGKALAFVQQCGVWRRGGAETALTTDSSGRLVLCGLSAGHYQLVQEDAPGLYRTLPAPLQLTLDDSGTLLVEGRPCREVALLHRSGRQVLTKAALGLCSALPATARLLFLWCRKQNES